MRTSIQLLAILTLAAVPVAATAADKLFEITVPKPTVDPDGYVLCPSRQFYDAAVSKGADKTTFIYYAARLVEAGDEQSMVKNLAGSEFQIPNNLIIPISSGQTASVGDIVLTWWQSGSGMQRAIVVGGTPKEPVVRYLDITLDNPSGAGEREDTLKANSFHLLKEPFQVGTTVAVDVGAQQRVGQLLAADEDSILVKEFAGKLQVYDRSKARALPIRPDVSAGATVDIVLFSSLKSATVTKVDETIGRVFATYKFGGSEKEKAFPFGEVLPR